MMSSTKKNVIAEVLLFFIFLCFVALLVLFAEIMVFNGTSRTKYRDPKVASKIKEGSILDVNGKVLSMQISVYNCVFDITEMNNEQLYTACNIASKYAEKPVNEIRSLCTSDSAVKRVLICNGLDANIVEEFTHDLNNAGLTSGIYFEEVSERKHPYGTHASQMIYKTEKILNRAISPKPEYSISVTYGNDIYLSLNMDVQYILDYAVTTIYSQLKPDFAASFVVNAKTGAIVAMSTYPHNDPDSHVSGNSVNNSNDPDLQIFENSVQNIAFIKNFNGLKPYFIEKIQDKNGNDISSTFNFDDLYSDDDEIIKLANAPENSVIVGISTLENPKYYVFIGVKNPQKNPEPHLFNAIHAIESDMKTRSLL